MQEVTKAQPGWHQPRPTHEGFKTEEQLSLVPNRLRNDGYQQQREPTEKHGRQKPRNLWTPSLDRSDIDRLIVAAASSRRALRRNKQHVSERHVVLALKFVFVSEAGGQGAVLQPYTEHCGNLIPCMCSRQEPGVSTDGCTRRDLITSKGIIHVGF